MGRFVSADEPHFVSWDHGLCPVQSPLSHPLTDRLHREVCRLLSVKFLSDNDAVSEFCTEPYLERKSGTRIIVHSCMHMCGDMAPS